MFKEMTKVSTVSEEIIWRVLKNWSLGRQKRTLRPSQIPYTSSSQDRVIFPELDLKEFSKLTIQSKKNVAILYHSRYCGACARASHVLLELLSLLQSSSCLLLARVDGDRVDLPWHFSLHIFPSLIFLPAKRKWDSRVFPEDAPWTMNTVTKFIVSNLEIEERPEVMLALCARWHHKPEESEEGVECVKNIRSTCLNGLKTRLKQYRESGPKSRQDLYHRLGFLKSVYLELIRVVDIQKSLFALQQLSKQFRIGCIP